MSAEESKEPTELGGKAPLVLGQAGAWMEEFLEVAVAEAGGGELAARDGLQQREVGGVTDAQRAEAAAAVHDVTCHGVEELRAGSRVVDDSEGVEVALVGALREFGAAMEVGDALAHRPPFELAVRVVVRRAEDLEVEGARDGGFDAEDAAGLVVHLD